MKQACIVLSLSCTRLPISTSYQPYISTVVESYDSGYAAKIHERDRLPLRPCQLGSQFTAGFIGLRRVTSQHAHRAPAEAMGISSLFTIATIMGFET